MTWLKLRWCFIGRLIGLFLIVASLFVAYWWFYKAAPMRHLANSKWRDMHSEEALWREEQKDYRRMGSSPDLEFRGDQIGYYGDKQWFLWLEEKATTDRNFRVCGCTDTALALMSNQYTNSWDTWTKNNCNRTQEEWIQAGFSNYGVSVHLPPVSDDTEPLLKLIGAKTWNFLMAGPQETNEPDAIPSYVQYNAFRWLRDSGFDPVKFAISNMATISSNNLIIPLIKYSKWQSIFPRYRGLGILAFGQQPRSSEILLLPRQISAITAYALMSVSMIAGIALFFFARTKTNEKPDQ